MDERTEFRKDPGRSPYGDAGTASGELVPARRGPVPNPALVAAAHVALGATTLAAGGVGAVVRRTSELARPITRVALRPPLLPRPLQPVSWLAALANRGAHQQVVALEQVGGLLDALVPMIAAEVLCRLDLTSIVLEQVDLDAIVAAVDIEAVIRRLDLTSIVLEQVDLDAIVAHVDLDPIIARLDLPAIATQVIDEIDLPEIIRESTGSVASETMRGVRLQSIAGDEALGRAVDRLLLRRRQRHTEARGLDRLFRGEDQDDTRPPEEK
ncbi:MAG TPA: hypothetical protein VMI11_04460 [Actinomycetes bacterium]|nr:hypothetical protein [Actinomycetes bacterium]